MNAGAGGARVTTGGGGRLGDLVRVLAALGPLEDDELALLAELLPGHDLPGPAASAAAPLAPRAVNAPAGLLPTPTEDSGVRPGRRRARRRLRSLAERLRQWRAVRRPGRSTLRARGALATAVGAFGLASAAHRRLHGTVGSALALVLVAIALAALIAAFGPTVLGWYRSPVRRASVTIRPALRPGQAAGAASGAAVALELSRTRWEAPPPPVPLAAPNQMRALAMALVASPVDGGLDVKALVAGLARRRPPGPRPLRVRRRSVAPGVQFLVDRSAAFEPFRGDVAGLRRALSAVASAAGLHELGFDADPEVVTWSRPGPEGRRTTGPYDKLLPPRPMPVVVVTDLGIGQARAGPPPPLPAVWARHCAMVRQAGCRPLYLVPYPASRRPSGLKELPAVYWTDGLRPGEVARLVSAAEARTW